MSFFLVPRRRYFFFVFTLRIYSPLCVVFIFRLSAGRFARIDRLEDDKVISGGEMRRGRELWSVLLRMTSRLTMELSRHNAH